MAKANKNQTKTVNRIWLGFFAFWFLLLTGLFETWFKSPGLKQWIEINSLLNDKKQEIQTVEATTEEMKNNKRQLETNPAAQEREIR